MQPKKHLRLQRRQAPIFTIAVAVVAVGSASAATYQWTGATSTDWATGTNWAAGAVNGQTITAGPAPTGVTAGHRLNVNNTVNQEAVYTAAQGTTNYNLAANRGLVIGSGAAATGGGGGTLRITGGKFSTVGSNAGDIIGNNGNTAALIIDGGEYQAGATVSLGLGNSVCTLTVNSGTATIPTLNFNTTTGTVNLNGGTLVANTIIRSAGTNILNFNGGILKPRISTTTFLADLANTTAYVKNGGLVIDTAGDVGTGVDVTLGEPLLEDPASTGGGLTKNGAGILTLTGAGTYTGPTVVNAGTLAIKRSGISTFASAISGSGEVVFNGTGTVTLAGTHMYTGPTFIDSGRVNLSGSLTSAVTVAFGASLGGEGSTTGSLTFNGTSNVFFDPGTPGALTAASIDAAAGSLSFAPATGGVAATGLVLLQSGAPIVGDIGANFLSNPRVSLSFNLAHTQLLADFTPGTLVWEGNDPVSPTYWDLENSLNWKNGATSDKFYTGDVVRFDDSAVPASPVDVALQTALIPGSVTFANNSKEYILSGAAIDGTTSLVMNGSGTVTLTATNTYAGGTTLNSGSITASALGAFGSGAVTIASGATLNLTSAATGAAGYTGIATGLAGAGTVNVTLSNGTDTRLFNGTNAGFTGTMNIGDGIATGKVQINGALGAATLNVLPNATVYVGLATNHPAAITLNGGDTGEVYGQLRLDSGAEWSGKVTLAAAITGIGDGHLGSFTGTGTVSGVIDDGGNALGLTKVGGGRIILTAANTYTGPTNIAGGPLQITHPDALGAGGVTTVAGTALELDGGISVANEPLTLVGGGAGGDFGALRGISGNNTWSGTITTGTGVSRIASDADLLTVNDIIAGALATDNLVLQGTGNVTVAGVISGATVLTSSSNGSGIRTVAGANTYTGQTRLNGGTLVATTLNSVNGGTPLLAASSLGAPTTDATGQITLGVGPTVPGEGTLRYVGTGETTDRTLLLNGAVLGGVLDQSGTGLLKFTGTVTAAAGGGKTLTLTGSTAGTGELAGVISENSPTSQVAIRKTGTGTWTLSGANTNTGNTAIEDGILSLSTPSLAEVSTVTIGLVEASPAVLNLNHPSTDVVAALVIDGVPQPNGVYDKDNSGGAITGAGKLWVGPSPYANWLTLYPALSDPSPGGDPDGDGMKNLLEAVLNGNPEIADLGILPDLDASGLNFIFTFTRRADSAVDTAQIFQYGSDLSNWTDVSITAPTGTEVSLGTPVDGLQSVTVTIPKTAAIDGKLFGRLKVSK